MISDPHAFWLEARHQSLCAVCERGGHFHAHHVVPKGLLKRLKLPLYDTRNALRLCPDCHMAFEWAGPGKVAVPITVWQQQNICYAFEVLGAAVVQLESRYGSFGVDERWVKHLSEECDHCQAPTAQTLAV